MNTTAIPSAELVAGFDEDLVALGFDISAEVPDKFSTTVIYAAPSIALQVQVRAEQCDHPGVDDLVSVAVLELDSNGWATGVEHRFSHVNVRNARAITGFVAALAETAA